TATTPAHAAGTVDVTVTTLGGTSAKSSSDQYTYAAVPTVTSLSPATGPIAGGTSVTITGTSLTGATAVSFGVTTATSFVVVNVTTITATAPAVIAGTVDVTVITPGGISAKSSADKYTYAAVPTVTGISPAAGPIVGGNVITITGTSLTGTTSVTIGGKPASSFKVTSATAVTATVPANTTAGTVDVTITTPGGTATGTGAYTYAAVPTITGISPAAGPTAGGTVITITGTNLTNATAVTFGSTAATHVTVVNATAVTATAPAHAAGTVDVTITTPGGTSAKSSADQYAYVAPPAVTAVAPAATPWYRNATVLFLITGANFVPGQTTVTFSYPSNGTALNPAGFTVNTVTATTINGSVVVPLNAPTGTWNVSVTTLYGGQVWKAAAFTVSNFPAPTITSITYPPGNIGTTVLFTITGTNFQTDSTKTSVTIYNDITNTVLPTTVLSTMPTTIVGSATISSSTPAGAYNVNVTTVDGGTASRPGSFTVGFVGIPTITSLTPVSGFLNTTVNFTVTGTSFEPGSTVVAFTNQTTSQTLTPIFYNVTSSTQISGNVSIPFNALSGPYRLDITTTDGGVVNKPNAFTVNAFTAPTIASITPTTPWYRNATVPFLITGTNFKSGQTTVAFNYPSNGTALNSTVAVNAVSATTISGTVVVPYSAPTGTWNVSVATIDGGTVWKPAAITVNQFPAPSITSITPAAGTKNSTVLFTLAGTNFEPVGTSVTIVEDTSGTVMNATLISVTPGSIVGNVTIPGSVPAGLYRLQVTTVDGGTVSKPQAFTVNYLPLPVITTLAPATGYRNTTVSFALTGNYFLNGGTTVMLRTVGTTLPVSTTFVNTTTIQGSFIIPSDAPTGSYTMYVITTGGGFNSKPNAFKVI
ncbi:MAG: IPT/TIG domain-containing protein, partial [Methanoregula sp.]|uniref:beta strand repeat-containing protein n=1 Tax=Methanoregula sp. TaxID=2052170 RepID=UPI003C3DF487